MKAAISVKSPFSHRALFGFTTFRFTTLGFITFGLLEILFRATIVQYLCRDNHARASPRLARTAFRIGFVGLEARKLCR
jgi:hypothetical protein